MTATGPPATTSSAELLRWSFDRLNAHDVASMRELWADDAVVRFPGVTCTGPDEIARYFEQLFEAIPDLTMRIEGIAEQGEDAFVRWHMTGTHAGVLEGAAGTGRPLAVDGIDHFVLRGGRIVSNFVVADRLQYAQQMGLMPPDGSRADRAAKALFNARTSFVRRVRG